MDQSVLITNIAKHLDSLETIISSIIVLAIGLAWAGVSKHREIEIAGAKFSRRHAFYAASAVFLVANMSILILFLRLGDMVILLDQSNILKAFTQLSTHRWVLNPFSFFGHSDIAKIYSSEGVGLLIAVWWLCNSSLSSLMDDKGNKAASILLGIFLVIGLASIYAINRVNSELLGAMKPVSPDIYALLLEASDERMLGVVIGIVVGVLIFVSVNYIQSKWIYINGDTQQ